MNMDKILFDIEGKIKKALEKQNSDLTLKETGQAVSIGQPEKLPETAKIPLAPLSQTSQAPANNAPQESPPNQQAQRPFGTPKSLTINPERFLT